MLHKRAAARADGAGWHYVIGKGEGGTPIGYCADHDPHPTEAEARECYNRFVREKTIKLDAGTRSWTNCRGRVDITPELPRGTRCPNPTREFASYGDDGYGILALCPEHRTREEVIRLGNLDGPAGDAWIS